MTIGGERNVDKAGPQGRRFLRSKAECPYAAGPITLDEDVGVPQQSAKRVDIRRFA